MFTGIARLDMMERKKLLRDIHPNLPGEALFVPKSNPQKEDDGWLITLVYMADSHLSELWILRADTLQTQARLALPHHVPLGFHGTWIKSQVSSKKPQQDI